MRARGRESAGRSRRGKRSTVAFVVALGCLASSAPARAEEPDPALALFSGAAVSLAGFVAGGTLLATAHGDSVQDNAGWLTIESGFTLAPLLAHGAVGEWGRGALFAAVPAAGLGTTAGIFVSDATAVERGDLPLQRWMWGLFGVSLFASAAGVVDAMLAPGRVPAVQIAPAVGLDQVGLQAGGSW